MFDDDANDGASDERYSDDGQNLTFKESTEIDDKKSKEEVEIIAMTPDEILGHCRNCCMSLCSPLMFISMLSCFIEAIFINSLYPILFSSN